jgi:two-component system, OmpR family, KDP operon response regulator KdpE
LPRGHRQQNWEDDIKHEGQDQMPDRILVVDDEVAIVKFLRSCLKTDGYEVMAAVNGVDALQAVERESPDLLVLDIVMPNMDGFEVLKRIREWSRIPILILSARHNEEDKVKCLDLGADDYLSKPFGINELAARIRVLLRRSTSASDIPSQPLVTIGDLEIDFAKRRVMVAGAEVALTSTEYSLLKELALERGKVFTHTELLRRVWGPEYGNEWQYLHVYISRLRAKIEADPKSPKYIKTMPGMGYMLQDRA